MILVELSKLLKDGKIDKHASRSSQFLQLVDAVFDEATPLTFDQMVRKYYR